MSDHDFTPEQQRAYDRAVDLVTALLSGPVKKPGPSIFHDRYREDGEPLIFPWECYRESKSRGRRKPLRERWAQP